MSRELDYELYRTDYDLYMEVQEEIEKRKSSGRLDVDFAEVVEFCRQRRVDELAEKRQKLATENELLRLRSTGKSTSEQDALNKVLNRNVALQEELQERCVDSPASSTLTSDEVEELRSAVSMVQPEANLGLLFIRAIARRIVVLAILGVILLLLESC